METPVVTWITCANCGHSLHNSIRVDPVLQSASPLVNLLDRIPSASEAAAARAALEETTSQINLLDEEIKAVEMALAELRSNREMLQTKSRHLSAVISPINRLPTELLSQIFGLCARDWKERQIGDLGLFATEAPLLICHVWRRWRQIALYTRSLWTYILIHVPPVRRRGKPQDQTSTARLQHWLNHSADLPLSVRIAKNNGAEFGVAESPALNLLLLHSARWQHLDLSISGDDLEQNFYGLRGRLVALKTLTLFLSPYGPTLTAPVDYFEDAPNLVTAELKSRFRIFGALKLPWHALTHLHTRGSLNYLLDALRHCPNLVSSEICSSSDSPEEQPIHHPVELPHVRWISANIRSVPYGLFFDSLTIPGLQNLQLTLDNGTPSHHVASFMSRSCHNLERFSIHGDIPTCSIIGFLEVAPCLKHASIHLGDKNSSTKDVNILLRRLTSDTSCSTDALLPSLEYLEFVLQKTPEVFSIGAIVEFSVGAFIGGFNDIFNKVFLDMLLSRRSSMIVEDSAATSTPKLRSVVISIIGDRTLGDPFRAKILGDFLRTCQAAGIVISISSKDGPCRIHLSL